MTPEVFVTVLAVVLTAVLTWSCKALPAEKWQMLAAVPMVKGASGEWSGVNLTWYGALTASGYGLAVAMGLVLLGAAHVPSLLALALVAAILSACVPASRWLARTVEKKENGFTVGGAVFVGTLVGPWIVFGLDRVGRTLGHGLDVWPALAAMAIAYTYGEGFGRLACISFGCCYGRPVDQLPPFLRRLFARRHFVFGGKTKKVAYASSLDGCPVVPVQALTSAIYLGTALLATLLFLRSHCEAAYVLAAVVTQGWRAVSENLRADFRGGGGVSAYQIMAVIGGIYSLGVAVLVHSRGYPPVDLAAGLDRLWRPEVLLLVQALWAALFLYTGKSTVTGATITFHVHRDRV